ncbi:MAG: LPS export ABC transporter permease LptF [Xanthomonadales bacterium]|nr:LPS export ABC transporter permease LptF [Gammaproteobacteria bacterium]MBT8052680.1 LPS export ABC transporter permease LptF [Gammaproteobacteria bacterium]NND56799.1 LPS export ABC transporter permease LptF [Xanthomonadales bacterium]NNK50662.1 LPS export ABC transporter permease LptF [Xanthomonadales bacterium]
MIIDHYLRREISVPFLSVSAVLLSIFVTYSLTRFLMDADAGLLQPGEIFQLTVLKSVISLEVLLPLSLYISVLAGLGRLHSDSEIYAMRASGISEMRALRPIIGVAVLLAIFIALFSFFVRPWAYGMSYEIKARAEAASEVDRIRAARFYSFKESGRTVFVRTVSTDGEQLGEVFIRSQKDSDLQVITAATGKLGYQAKPDFHQLTLYDASVYRRVHDGPDVFAQLGLLSVWIPAGVPDPVGYKTKSSDMFALSNASNTKDVAEFQWRFSTPVTALLLALLAIPLSRSRPRQGRYARILAALLIYAVYFNLLDVSRTWVEQGTTRTIWWAPGTLALLVLVLYVPWKKVFRPVIRLRVPAA